MSVENAPRLGRPPGSRREDTLARVLDAAQAHFGDRGYAGSRVVDIARDAGMTHSLLYQYYPSKAELYAAALQAALDEILPLYLDAIADADTFKEKIAAMFRASSKAHAAHPAITPFLASVPLELRRHPGLLDGTSIDPDPLMGAFSGMFAEARKAGEIPTDVDDLDLLAGFVGAAMGVGLLTHGLGRESMDAPVEALLAAFDGRFFR